MPHSSNHSDHHSSGKFSRWWRKIVRLSQPSMQGSQKSKNKYRTQFSRYLWAFGFLTTYLLMTVLLINDSSSSGSTDNSGIWKMLIGAIITGCIGAFFAPRFNEYFMKRTPQGRREQAEHRRRAAAKEQKGKGAHSHSHSAGGSLAKTGDEVSSSKSSAPPTQAE